MSFTADKQTLEDLNMLGRHKPGSIFSLFNKVHTAGGARLLDAMFRAPLSDAEEINRRCRIFGWFGGKARPFPIDKGVFAMAENYLGTAGERNFPAAAAKMGRLKVLALLIRDGRYDGLESGLRAAGAVLTTFREFMLNLEQEDPDNPYQEQIEIVKKIFSDRRLQWLSENTGSKKMPLLAVARRDHRLRQGLQEEIGLLLRIIYDLDVCMAVGQVALEKGFNYPHALPKERDVFLASGLRHPSIPKAVANPLSFSKDKNVLFLTGANMAGKSTFMKSVGIAVYLAHMGFPVAAEGLEFSIKDGLFSSINVPDDLGQGYSHFYAEVMRVKRVAEEVGRSRDLVVLFDELFKGTNVKDAYDATLAVTQAFSEYRNCFFIISTHIVEVGEKLKEECDNLRFVYFPTGMEGTVPVYSYRLQDGISTDRHGMMIIANERILEIMLHGK